MLPACSRGRGWGKLVHGVAHNVPAKGAGKQAAWLTSVYKGTETLLSHSRRQQGVSQPPTNLHVTNVKARGHFHFHSNGIEGESMNKMGSEMEYCAQLPLRL